jgi:hypothetical protein
MKRMSSVRLSAALRDRAVIQPGQGRGRVDEPAHFIPSKTACAGTGSRRHTHHMQARLGSRPWLAVRKCCRSSNEELADGSGGAGKTLDSRHSSPVLAGSPPAIADAALSSPTAR